MDLFDIEKVASYNEKLKRIKELSKLILKYQKSYYNGEGEIPDSEFDLLWDELKSIDPENPVLQKVGQDSGNFKKIHHIMPMGSQEKAANPEQFLSWAQNHVYSEYLVEYKLDGASLELQYKDGNLLRCVTRGDGTVGDDITQNAIKMNGVVKFLPQFTGGVRGEVIMSHHVHDTLYADKANCRNAANGLMKRKDGNGSENLTLIVYDALSTEGENPFSDEEEKIAWLTSSGFNVVPLMIFKKAEDVIDYRAIVMEKRKTLDYDIDGLVIKERKINFDDASRARPDRQIAFKFSLEEAVSVVRYVEWSESGATYTPVAIFDPVELAGTIVKRASLANPDTLRALSVKIGSHVVVVKRGEIIPKIERVLQEENVNETKEIEFPKKCAACGNELVDSGSRLFCPNKLCKKRILHQLYKWIASADIRDLGDTLVQQMFQDKVLDSISSIYSLSVEKLTPYFLNEESIKDEKKSLGAQKVFSSIQSHRNLSLASFVAGFDIEGIGESMVEKLVSSGYNTLEKMLEAKATQFEEVYGFAKITADTLFTGLNENKDEMLYLTKNNIIVLEENVFGVLEGKSFCFTGELHTLKRSDAESLVKKLGGSVKSSVTKDLSFLVTNDTSSGSSKNVKAQKFGIPIITEEEFLKLAK